MGNCIDECGLRRRTQSWKWMIYSHDTGYIPLCQGGRKEKRSKDWNLGHYNFWRSWRERGTSKGDWKGTSDKVRGKPGGCGVLGVEGRVCINKGKDLLGQEDLRGQTLVKKPEGWVVSRLSQAPVQEATLPPSLSPCPFLCLSNILLHSSE